MKRLQIVLLVASLAMQPIMAQYSRGMSRHYRYNSGRSSGDMVEVTVREPGTLEERMPKEMQERVRMLRIEGPLNERDLAYITKLAKRSKVLNAEGFGEHTVLSLQTDLLPAREDKAALAAARALAPWLEGEG